MATATAIAGASRVVSNAELIAKYPNEAAILAAVASGALTVDSAQICLAALERKASRGKLSCKVSEKGALSVYGLQRMPVTLYVEQWERLLDFADEIKAFMAANNGKLTRKTR
jgi:hypothetical protein